MRKRSLTLLGLLTWAFLSQALNPQGTLPKPRQLQEITIAAEIPTQISFPIPRTDVKEDPGHQAVKTGWCYYHLKFPQNKCPLLLVVENETHHCKALKHHILMSPFCLPRFSYKRKTPIQLSVNYSVYPLRKRTTNNH